MCMDRIQLCADVINNNYSKYSLLDMGCRTMDLKPHLNSCVQYSGTDFIPGPNVFECNLEEGLPFDDNSYDIVVALDVLEHLENIHTTLIDAFRVARKSVIISLPNIHYIQFRWLFLRGKGITGKYKFHAHPVLDRHRWVMSYYECLRFIEENTKKYDVKIYDIIPKRGRTRMVSEPIEKLLAKRWPNLFVYGVMAEIKLNKKISEF
jgi:predicted SAM-dependent methyltransferase